MVQETAMPQHSAQPTDAKHVQPRRRRTTPTAADLVAIGAITAQQAYSAG